MTWRVTASLTTFLIAWILTGDLLIGISIGSIEAITKIFLYYFHKRIWNNILLSPDIVHYFLEI